MFKIANIPNILTLLRILIIPIILVFLEIDNEFYRWLALLLYIIACLSDFLDGYLARKFELESSFGRFLDPVADKILVVSVIFILISNGIIKAYLYTSSNNSYKRNFSLRFKRFLCTFYGNTACYKFIKMENFNSDVFPRFFNSIK